jgi:quaternary ammonium compound-resistance protein SugE
MARCSLRSYQIIIMGAASIRGVDHGRRPANATDTVPHPSSVSMSWLLLLVAGLFEAVWAIGLEYSDGFTKPRPTAVTVVAMAISVVLLARAVRELPIGTAYAVWTGIGAVVTVIYGLTVLDEPASPARLFFLGFIVVGIVGLHQTGG